MEAVNMGLRISEGQTTFEGKKKLIFMHIYTYNIYFFYPIFKKKIIFEFY